MKYIPLDAVVAEIERLIGDYNIKTEKYRGRNEQAHQYYGGKRDALSEMLKSIVSMQKEAKKEAVIKVEKIMAGVDTKFPKFCEEVRNCDPHFAVNIDEYKDPNFGVNNFPVYTEPKPKFKVGDTIYINHYTKDYMYTIKEVQDDCYVLDNDKVLTFNEQDEWELLQSKEPVSDDLEKAAINAADEDMQGRQIME